MNGDVCEDCVKFITDAQEEAKKNSTFVSSMIEQIESQCDLLGPGLADMVSLKQQQNRKTCFTSGQNYFKPPKCFSTCLK